MKFYKIISFKRHNAAGIIKVVVNNLTKGEVVSEEYVDLYHPLYNNSNNVYEEFRYWITVSDEDQYEVVLSQIGAHNPNAVSPYTMEILNYFMVFEIAPTIEATLELWHTLYPNNIYRFSAINNEMIFITQTVEYSANDITKIFNLPSNYSAYTFTRISDNGGATWIYPNDSRITWGSNETKDDELIKDGLFGVKFNIAPESGRQILLEFIPLINSAKITHTIKQPQDPNEINFIDYGAPISVMDYSAEFIK